MMTAPSTPTTRGHRGPRPRGRLTRGELALLAVAALTFLHHIDHVLRADHSGWPFTPQVTAFTVSLAVYPVVALDFLLLRRRPWIRVGLVAGLFAALQVAHTTIETPVDQYGTWADGMSSTPDSFGQPNLLHLASPALGILSVVVSALLSVAVLAALVLLTREARATRPRPWQAATRRAATPTTSQGWLLRIGSVAGITGALLGMAGNLVHPALPAPSQDPEGLARALATSDMLLPSLFTILLGLILMLGGVIAIACSITAGLPGALARLARSAAVGGTAVGLTLLIIDGVAARHLARAWATAPPEQQAAALHALMAEETINFALGSLFYILFAGVTFVLLGLAVARSGMYPRWLGWVAAVAGASSVVIGLAQGYVGESNAATRIPSIAVPAVISLWLVWMGVLVLRKTSELERAAAPQAPGDAPGRAPARAEPFEPGLRTASAQTGPAA